MSFCSIAKPLLACLLIAIVFKVASLGHYADPVEIQHWLDEQGNWGWPMLIVVGTLLMLIGFPRQVVAFIGGSLLGVSLGTTVSTAMAGVACAITFLLSRFFYSNG